MGPRLSSEAMCPGVAGTDHTPARKSMAALDKHVVAGGVGAGEAKAMEELRNQAQTSCGGTGWAIWRGRRS